MDLIGGGFTLRSLRKFNVLLGKNGCGKSTVLKRLDEHLDKNALSLSTGNLLRTLSRIEKRIKAANVDDLANGHARFMAAEAANFLILPEVDLEEVRDATEQLWRQQVRSRARIKSLAYP